MEAAFPDDGLAGDRCCGKGAERGVIDGGGVGQADRAADPGQG